ncbi:MAG TPA: hypothetical protein ENJ37_00165 [Deltaproteobacteria bacterium]|nr:hypothetical protein [Deltaproteobacteria bacterium]
MDILTLLCALALSALLLGAGSGTGLSAAGRGGRSSLRRLRGGVAGGAALAVVLAASAGPEGAAAGAPQLLLLAAALLLGCGAALLGGGHGEAGGNGAPQPFVLLFAAAAGLSVLCAPGLGELMGAWKAAAAACAVAVTAASAAAGFRAARGGSRTVPRLLAGSMALGAACLVVLAVSPPFEDAARVYRLSIEGPRQDRGGGEVLAVLFGGAFLAGAAMRRRRGAWK